MCSCCVFKCVRWHFAPIVCGSTNYVRGRWWCSMDAHSNSSECKPKYNKTESLLLLCSTPTILFCFFFLWSCMHNWRILYCRLFVLFSPRKLPPILWSLCWYAFILILYSIFCFCSLDAFILWTMCVSFAPRASVLAFYCCRCPCKWLFALNISRNRNPN